MVCHLSLKFQLIFYSIWGHQAIMRSVHLSLFVCLFVCLSPCPSSTTVDLLSMVTISVAVRALKLSRPNWYTYSPRQPLAVLRKQKAFEKCWAHSPLRAAALPFTRCRYCRPPPLSHAAAHRCPQQHRQQRQRQQRQRVTEGTAMAPWNGPNKKNERN